MFISFEKRLFVTLLIQVLLQTNVYAEDLTLKIPLKNGTYKVKNTDSNCRYKLEGDYNNQNIFITPISNSITKIHCEHNNKFAYSGESEGDSFYFNCEDLSSFGYCKGEMEYLGGYPSQRMSQHFLYPVNGEFKLRVRRCSIGDNDIIDYNRNCANPNAPIDEVASFEFISDSLEEPVAKYFVGAWYSDEHNSCSAIDKKYKKEISTSNEIKSCLNYRGGIYKKCMFKSAKMSGPKCVIEVTVEGQI